MKFTQRLLRIMMSKAQKLNSLEPQFSKFRAALWPIQACELKKFLPMGLLMFFVLFNYTLLRNTKDTLVITAPACGAEVLPFLKPLVMICAILFFLIYTKLSNILSRSALFYTCLSPFLIFFAAFAFIIYPYKDLLHPSLDSILILREACPNFKWIISIYGIWSYAIFYILAELWGVIVVALLFWQFANEITRTQEAKRFYSLFGLIGNISLITVGSLVGWFSNLLEGFNAGEGTWGASITYIMLTVISIGIGIIFIYAWMNRYVLTDPFYYDAAESIGKKKKEDKPKLSITESLRYLLCSKYLGFMAILVLSYGISMNLIDVTWKSQIKAYLPNPNDYFSFMGQFSFWTGISTIILILCTKGIIRRFGWFTGAIITPLVVLSTSALFFAFVLFQENLNGIVILLGTTSLFMAVMVGAVQNIFCKGIKYSLFDPSKEMAYIPLDQELKVKGKAAVDVIGGRLGKTSGGSIEIILLTLTAGSQLTIAPYLFIIIAIVGIAWVGAVKNLSKLYKEKVSLRESNLYHTNDVS